MVIYEQWFGIHVLTVQDVLGPQKITRVPLASKEISGALNLRGRIVTDILSRTATQIPDDGYLFLDGAETVIGVSDRFKPLSGNRGLYCLTNPSTN